MGDGPNLVRHTIFAGMDVHEGAWTYRMQAGINRKLHDRLEGNPRIARDR